jgi:enediyne biosynthesis protein E4
VIRWRTILASVPPLALVPLLALPTACGSAAEAPAAPPSTAPGLVAEAAVSGATPAAGGPGTLTDATDDLGIGKGLLGVRGHAVAAADVNADGWTDLFVGTFADRPLETYRERGADGPAPDRLLLGSATGFVVDDRFEGRLGRTAGAVFADLDGDGDPDLAVSRNVRAGERADAPSEIYRNDGGRLSPAWVLDASRGGRAVRPVDFDRDGLPDLVLVEDRWSGASTGLFHNEGGLRFREVTSEVGFPADVDGLGAAIGDLDGDGIDDLVIGGSNRWFLGDGTGFREGAASPLPWARPGDEDDPANVVLFDADGDGRLDIGVGQHFNSTIDAGRPEPVRLYLNRAGEARDGPRFEDATRAVGLPPLSTKSPQIVVLDLDGDGQEDLVTTASYPSADNQLTPLVLYHRRGGDGLPRFEGPSVATGPHYWIDAVVLDANGDGRLDVFMVEWEPAVGSRLFLNLPPAAQ